MLSSDAIRGRDVTRYKVKYGKLVEVHPTFECIVNSIPALLAVQILTDLEKAEAAIKLLMNEMAALRCQMAVDDAIESAEEAKRESR